MHILLYVCAILTVFLTAAHLLLFPRRKKHSGKDGRSRLPSRRRAGLARAAACINAGLVAVGLGAVLLAALLASREAKGAGGEMQLWAWDTFRLWAESAGLFSALIGGTCLAAAVIRHKMRTVRTLAAAAAAVLIVIMGNAYAVVCLADGLHMETWVLLFGAGCAAAVSAGNLADLVRLRREHAPKDGDSAKKSAERS